MSVKDDRKQIVANLYGLATELGAAALCAARFAQAAIPTSADSVQKAPGSKVAEVGTQALEAAASAADVVGDLTALAIKTAREIEREEKMGL